jgi:uncharacterized damage-inducible protein DinB
MTHPAGLHPAEAYDYLVVARGTLLDWIRPLTPEQYAREFPIGHKSIRATLVHVASAEWGYVRRLRGEPVPPPDERPFARYAGEPFAALERAWAGQAEETRRTLREVRDWAQPLEGVTSAGERRRRFRTTTGGVALQLLFHEVHHRAQVMAMLRQLGIAAENLDYSVLGFQYEDA